MYKQDIVWMEGNPHFASLHSQDNTLIALIYLDKAILIANSDKREQYLTCLTSRVASRSPSRCPKPGWTRPRFWPGWDRPSRRSSPAECCKRWPEPLAFESSSARADPWSDFSNSNSGWKSSSEFWTSSRRHRRTKLSACSACSRTSPRCCWAEFRSARLEQEGESKNELTFST